MNGISEINRQNHDVWRRAQFAQLGLGLPQSRIELDPDVRWLRHLDVRGIPLLRGATPDTAEFWNELIGLPKDSLLWCRPAKYGAAPIAGCSDYGLHLATPEGEGYRTFRAPDEIVHLLHALYTLGPSEETWCIDARFDPYRVTPPLKKVIGRRLALLGRRSALPPEQAEQAQADLALLQSAPR